MTQIRVRVLGMFVIAAAVLGCGGAGKGSLAQVAGDGAIALAIDGTGLTIGSVSYTITGPAGFSRTGTIDVSASAALSALIGNLPAGTGYSIVLSATASDGATACAGSATFSVIAGAATAVSVVLDCHAPAATGSLLVAGSINVCPQIDGLSASPSAVTVGNSIALTAAAHDPDRAPAPLAYSWTASAGTLSSATSATPTFTCTAAGTATVTLTVSDGDPLPSCAATQTVTLACQAGFALTATPSDLAPGQSASVQATATDGAAHAGASYGWSDGLNTMQAGVWSPGATTTAGSVTYTPAGCNALGSGDHVITLGLDVADPALPVPGAATTTVTVHCPAAYYTTKTPYQPFQDPTLASQPPPGFSPVFVETVTRHGSRGLSSLKYDAAALAMWQKAQSDGALTPLGAQLGPDIQTFMRANALLGYGVQGITNPGYGNLTRIGITEQQQLAVRLVQRLPSYFAAVAAAGGARQIVTVSSGMDRAVDSDSFFSASLGNQIPGLASVITPAAPLTAYPASAPVTQAAGVNHFLLYFHKLNAAADLVTNPADPYDQTYQDSLTFQAYASNADMTARVASVLSDPSVNAAATTVMQGLFTQPFLDNITNGTYSFANTGSFAFTSDDGLFTTTLTGDGKTKIKTLVDAVSMLYNLYVVGPAMVNEAGVDFGKYIPAAQLQTLAYLQDAQDFYQMGPSLAETAPVTYKMAAALQKDFFTEIDAIAAGDLSHAAKLRFTHAEIVVPFADIMGLDGASTPVPEAQTYTYASNPWRGQTVASMATNQQWDVFRDASGTLIVRLLYDEKEVDFKAACAGTRYAPGTHFYEYQALKACYGL